MKLTYVLFFLTIVISGCTNIQANIYNKQSFTDYKTAYIKHIENDQFDIKSLVIEKLSEKGLSISSKEKPDNAISTDVIVKINYVEGWDMAKFAKVLKIQFIDAKTETIVATGSYTNGWYHSAKFSVTKIFKEFKENW